VTGSHESSRAPTISRRVASGCGVALNVVGDCGQVRSGQVRSTVEFNVALRPRCQSLETRLVSVGVGSGLERSASVSVSVAEIWRFNGFLKWRPTAILDL